jgi:hypothetical protein
MKRLSPLVFAAVLVVSASLRAHPEASGGANNIEQTRTDHCAYWISAAPEFKVCISTTGTLAFLHVGNLPFVGNPATFRREGHVLCHAGGSYYYDGTWDDSLYPYLLEDGWQDPVLVSRSGSKVVVRRTTTDDRFTLTQTWTRNVTERATTVTSELQANVATNGVYFARAARVLFLGARGEWSAHGYWIGKDGFDTSFYDAISVTDTSFVPRSEVYAWAHTSYNAMAIAAYCRANHDVPPYRANSSTGPVDGFIRYFAGDMAAGQTKTYSVTYRGH